MVAISYTASSMLTSRWGSNIRENEPSSLEERILYSFLMILVQADIIPYFFAFLALMMIAVRRPAVSSCQKGELDDSCKIVHDERPPEGAVRLRYLRLLSMFLFGAIFGSFTMWMAIVWLFGSFTGSNWTPILFIFLQNLLFCFGIMACIRWWYFRNGGDEEMERRDFKKGLKAGNINYSIIV